MDEVIRGSKTILRPLEVQDVEKIIDWMQNPKVSSRCLDKELYVESNLKEWFSNCNTDEKRYILNTADNKSIGKVFLTIKDNTGYINVMIGDEIYGGKGYGKDAIKAVVKQCFEVLNLDGVKAVFHKNNVRAEYCCFSCGFKLEESSTADDAQYTMVLMRSDYIGY